MIQCYRKNMFQANGFSAVQIKPATTISVLEYKPLTCSLLQVNTLAERPPFNFFSGSKCYLQQQQSSNEGASRGHNTTITILYNAIITCIMSALLVQQAATNREAFHSIYVSVSFNYLGKEIYI